MNRTVMVTFGLALAAGLVAQEPEAPAAKRLHQLMVGDAAPPLAIQTFVKGEPVKAFAPGTVYVVEFWATWCGPCIMGMPHLSALQEKYADKNVRIIGVNIWDEPEKVAPFMKNNAPIHKKPGDAIMRYTVAIEEKDDADDVRNGRMAKEWMQAAGREGIPSAFIVDQKARIAWIGHPSEMDFVLEKVVEGQWDLAQEARNYVVALEGEAKVEKYQALFEAADYANAYELGREIVAGPLANNAMALNQVAWRIVDPDNLPKEQDLKLALQAAKRAVELTKEQNAAILDTLATVHHGLGDLTAAVKWQRLAVHQAKDDEAMAAELKQRLQQFERELAAKEAAAKDKKKDDGTDK